MLLHEAWQQSHPWSPQTLSNLGLELLQWTAADPAVKGWGRMGPNGDLVQNVRLEGDQVVIGQVGDISFRVIATLQL